MQLIPYFKYWRFVLIIVSILIIALSCKSPTKTTPENTQELADCSTPGLTYNQPDSTSCICIDNANWNTDSTACECNNIFSFNSDSTICVMDTTSHDFTWVIDTLGIYGSFLRDVHIVNENDIWVVGDIIVQDPDSSFNGTGYETLNMAHWDGVEWELMGLESQDEQIGHPGIDSVIENISDRVALYTIQYFGDEDIWVTSSGFPIHWDGENWTLYHLQNAGLDVSVGDACWGTSSSNIYFVGRDGSIVHYNGAEFVQMESGTDLHLTDIWGNDEDNIWVAGGWYNGFESIILKKEGNGWTKIYENLIDSDLFISSIYTADMELLYTAGDIISFYNLITGEINYFDHPGIAVSFKVRGNNANDIFYAGEFGEVIHFNGHNWTIYPELISHQNRFSSIDTKGDFAVVVGQIYYPSVGNSIGMVARGYR